MIDPSDVRVTDLGDEGPVDAEVRGSRSDLWLLLVGRRAGTPFEVEGSLEAFDRLRAAIGRAPVPRRP